MTEYIILVVRHDKLMMTVRPTNGSLFVISAPRNSSLSVRPSMRSLCSIGFFSVHILSFSESMGIRTTITCRESRGWLTILSWRLFGQPQIRNFWRSTTGARSLLYMFDICKAILRKQHSGIRILTDNLFHHNFRGNSLIHFYSLEKRHKLIFGGQILRYM